jgi:hypothetical protein
MLYKGVPKKCVKQEIVKKNDYIWSLEAEKYLLENAKSI